MSYRQVLRDRRLAALLSGDVVSKVGDGMLLVALPLQVLASYTGARPAVAIGLVAAAPFVLSTAVSLRFGLGRARYNPRAVMLTDSALRATAVSGAGIAALTGALPVWDLAAVLLVGSGLRLLAASARRLTATGMAGERGRFAVNGLLGTSDSLALYIAGPALGGTLAAITSPATVLVISGCTCLALLVAITVAVPSELPLPTGNAEPDPASGWMTLRRVPVAATLFAVVFAFNLFYMPVEIALPLLVQGPLQGTAASLGLIWTSFGLGALAGAIATNQLRRIPQGPLLLAVIAGWTTCVAVLAAAPNTYAAAAALTVGGFIYAPFTPIAYSLVQDRLTPHQQQPVITLWAAGTVLAAPIGLVLGGPLIQATGIRGGLVASVLLTAALVPVAAWGLRRARPAEQNPTENS
jgi:hypothetical protein